MGPMLCYALVVLSALNIVFSPDPLLRAGSVAMLIMGTVGATDWTRSHRRPE